MHREHVEKRQAKEDCRCVHKMYLLYNTNKENKEVSSTNKEATFLTLKYSYRWSNVKFYLLQHLFLKNQEERLILKNSCL